MYEDVAEWSKLQRVLRYIYAPFLLEVINVNCVKKTVHFSEEQHFSERVVNVGNSLPKNVAFSTLTSFRP